MLVLEKLLLPVYLIVFKWFVQIYCIFTNPYSYLEKGNNERRKWFDTTFHPKEKIYIGLFM